MKINKNIVIASLITSIIKIVDSSSFCTDPDDYECKDLGITKCVPKLNRSTTWKPLPIEKPPCAVACLDTDSWCEERGACIGQDELCDCGPDKIYCTSAGAYSCESRKGILQSNIFNICLNGDCRNNCSVGEEERVEGCGEGQFMCGGTCLDNVEAVRFRTCSEQCISVHKTCFTNHNETATLIYTNQNQTATIPPKIIVIVPIDNSSILITALVASWIFFIFVFLLVGYINIRKMLRSVSEDSSSDSDIEKCKELEEKGLVPVIPF